MLELKVQQERKEEEEQVWILEAVSGVRLELKAVGEQQWSQVKESLVVEEELHLRLVEERLVVVEIYRKIKEEQ
jgi:hypothetical protein